MRDDIPPLQLPFDFAQENVVPSPIDSNFDVSFADQLAKLESFNKHLYRPNTYLHKWWARRCGTTFRAILKSLVNEAEKRDFYAPGGLSGKVILDPMLGGGTTLHEAIRLGANVIGADIDPIPVLQARATLTAVSLSKLTATFHALFDQLHEQIGHYFQTSCPYCTEPCPQRFVLYGVRKRCRCHEVLIVDSLTLRHNSDGSKITLSPDNYAIYHDDRCVSQPAAPLGLLIYERKQKRCLDCDHVYSEDLTVPFYRRYEPIAVVGKCPTHRLFFAAPQQADLDLIAAANEARKNITLRTADFLIATGPKSKDLLNRGIDNYLDLFSSRQLLYLQHAIAGIATLDTDARLKLAMLISTSTEFNSMLCGYKGASKRRSGIIRHAFAYHAYVFPYTAIENNPLHPSRASGTLNNLFESRIVRGRKWAENPIERQLTGATPLQMEIVGERDAGEEQKTFAALKKGEQKFLLLQGSSANLSLPDASVDYIVTDPPYFDSVQYSDLSNYFRVWLAKLLPTEVDWAVALGETAVDQRKNGDDQYEQLLSGIFAECGRVLKADGGRLIFTFHHWNPKGWAALTTALKLANFRLMNHYVIHAENKISVHIANQNALLHDVILVLSKQIDVRRTPAWKRPLTIPKNDSYHFCAGCGDLLGHMLRHSFPLRDVHAVWHETLLA